MMTGVQLRKSLQSLWTTSEVANGFGVTNMTIFNWRRSKGFPCCVLPCNDEGRDAVRFIPQEVRQWARDNGYRFKEPSTRAA
jgi:hypothetical protein